MQHERALERKGRLTDDPVARRALRLLATSGDAPRCLRIDEAALDENITKGSGRLHYLV